MTAKLEIQWTPIINKFITWGPEICLYEIHTQKDLSPQSIRLSNTSYASLLATNTNHHDIKCLDIYPKTDLDILMAIGLSNGRLSLTTFGPSKYDALGLTGKELIPRHARQCNTVKWNCCETNLIAAGLDKYRPDNSVLIWDITKYSQINSDNMRMSLSTVVTGVEIPKPVAEFGLGETANSLAWFNNTGKILTVGMNWKNIRIVDIRDTNKIVNSNLTKAVFGLCVDPNDDRHLASFIDNQISVWDTRNFEKPIQILTHNKPVTRIDWCPTKYNSLASLQKDSSIVNLYDIKHTVIGNQEIEPSVLERVVAPGSPHNIMSFSWHKNDENRLLTIALSGTIMDYTVFDRITLNWAPTSNIIWSYGRKTMKMVNDVGLNDISTKMKDRAIAGYGLKKEYWKNGELVGDDEMLANVWNWLQLSNKLVSDGSLQVTNTRHPGVMKIVSINPSTEKSEMVSMSWNDLGFHNCVGGARIFKHPNRYKALRLCSWPFDRDTALLQKFLENLEKEKAYTRAAAIALFSLKIRLAIEILARAPDNNLNVVAMALAGFSDDKSSVWKQFCLTNKHKLTDPYLKVIFNFLTAENYNYDNILNENGIAVDDRVAFACIFLPDNKLEDYLNKLLNKLIEEGNLDGLLITGNDTNGLELLRKYLNATGDVQSTALFAVQAFNDFNPENYNDWIASYRNLLDTWKLWNERAQFDIMLRTFLNKEQIPQQLYLSCNFCGKSIVSIPQGTGRGKTKIAGSFMWGAMPNKLKMSSCPNCRKPLPRCAICLMYMGTTTGANNNKENNKLSDWFTWCQTCRHGGHSTHMVHWFKEHSECPVTGCICKCFSIDDITNNRND